MYNKNIPADRELPSTAKLIKSTIVAAAAAGVLLVTVVMPAEYGIDPTGIGGVIGLKKMGQIKVSLAEEAASEAAAEQAKQAQPAPAAENAGSAQAEVPTQSHEMQVTLVPDQGTEIKVAMTEGAKVTYEWWTDGGKANFDVHGDSEALGIDYHNYSKGSETRSSDELVAAFDGSHGWFWRNRTEGDITITLRTNGEYSSIKQY